MAASFIQSWPSCLPEPTHSLCLDLACFIHLLYLPMNVIGGNHCSFFFLRSYKILLYKPLWSYDDYPYFHVILPSAPYLNATFTVCGGSGWVTKSCQTLSVFHHFITASKIFLFRHISQFLYPQGLWLPWHLMLSCVCRTCLPIA